MGCSISPAPGQCTYEGGSSVRGDALPFSVDTDCQIAFSWVDIPEVIAGSKQSTKVEAIGEEPGHE